MDASLSGWGALWNSIPIQGRWSAAESQLPINLLELRAIRLVLRHWESNLRVVMSWSKRTTWWQRHMSTNGGSKSTALYKEAVLLFHWAEWWLVLIRVEHIRGRDNRGKTGSVDRLSIQGNGP